MKQSLFRWLNTFILISALAANLLPTLQTAAANNQDNAISQNSERSSDEPETTLPTRTGRKSPLAAPDDLCLGMLTALYRPGNAPNPA
ncbi:MAG: hypothetical protein K8I82_01395, partial [Anaerolineae bacterium]|nr:hypothetical protein [Anaerolineae bacterium]